MLNLLSGDGSIGTQGRLDLLVRGVELGADLLQPLCHLILGDNYQRGFVASESLTNLLQIILGESVAELPNDRAAECADGRAGEDRLGEDQTDEAANSQA